jgi:hypothetical protein
MEGVILAPTMPFDLSLLLRSEIGQNLKSRTPLFELHLPIYNDCSWYNNQVMSPDSFITRQRCKHRNSLDSFS